MINRRNFLIITGAAAIVPFGATEVWWHRGIPVTVVRGEGLKMFYEYGGQPYALGMTEDSLPVGEKVLRRVVGFSIDRQMYQGN